MLDVGFKVLVNDMPKGLESISLLLKLAKNIVVTKPVPSNDIQQLLQPKTPEVVPLIALFDNMRTLKYKAKFTITFYAAFNHYCNGHPKAETNKMDRNPPITNQERDLLTSLKYRTCFLRGP